MTKILVDKAVIEQALNTLNEMELYSDGVVYTSKNNVEEAITALRKQLAEQAEQEPDYFGLTHDHTWLSIDKKQYDKLKPEGRMTCYANPVRTKDLTDDELIALWESSKECISFKEYEDCARAVIAADREKNNANNNT